MTNIKKCDNCDNTIDTEHEAFTVNNHYSSFSKSPLYKDICEKCAKKIFPKEWLRGEKND